MRSDATLLGIEKKIDVSFPCIWTDLQHQISARPPSFKFCQAGLLGSYYTTNFTLDSYMVACSYRYRLEPEPDSPFEHTVFRTAIR